MFADDIVLCGADETDMPEYLGTWRRALEERGMGSAVQKPNSWTLTLKRRIQAEKMYNPNEKWFREKSTILRSSMKARLMMCYVFSVLSYCGCKT